MGFISATVLKRSSAAARVPQPATGMHYINSIRSPGTPTQAPTGNGQYLGYLHVECELDAQALCLHNDCVVCSSARP